MGFIIFGLFLLVCTIMLAYKDIQSIRKDGWKVRWKLYAFDAVLILINIHTIYRFIFFQGF